MMKKKSSKLLRIQQNIHRLIPKDLLKKCGYLCFQKICFDESEERIIGFDIKGISYLLEFHAENWIVKDLGYIGYPTLISFNPINKLEVIAGFTSGELKIFKINNTVFKHHSMIQGHELPPTWISFNKNNCLTSSKKEAIIWNLEFYTKLNLFRIKKNECYIKKTAFLSSSSVVILYENYVLEVWHFENFNLKLKVCLLDYGLKIIKDFVFTENGRIMIVCSARKILVFNTVSWSLMKNFRLSNNSSGIKKLTVIPLPLDARYNKIFAIIFNDGKLQFFDLVATSFIESSNHVLINIRKVIVSAHGQWIAWIQYDGTLNIGNGYQLIKGKQMCTKSAVIALKPKIHYINQHLNYVQRSVTKTLKLTTLQPILEEFGEYPERYRAVIWTTLMKLPGNKKAFSGSSHTIFKDSIAKVVENCRLADENIETLLILICDRLIQLNPFLTQSSFLVELVFPFVIIFKNTPLYAYEAILTVLLNFCQKWFEYHPFPPLNILGIIENILIEIDPNLVKFYYENGVTSIQYAWPLLKTLMSEVLIETEWLILWDHLLSYKNPLFLLMCVIAYNICLRQTIFSLKEKKEIEKFFRQQGHIKAKELIKISLHLDHKISVRNHPSQYLRHRFFILPREGSYRAMLIEQYPKFLIENSVEIVQLLHMRENEFNLHTRQERKKTTAEQKRINKETKNFVRQIQQKRTTEFKQCYEKRRLPSKLYLYDKHLGFHKHKILQNIKNVNVRSLEMLQDNIQELEDEVHTFLNVLKSNK